MRSAEFEACITNPGNYTRDILRKLEELKLGWQGMNVEQVPGRVRCRVEG